MAPVTLQTVVLWLGAAFASLMAAGLFLLLGWRGRRRGDTPYCRSCGYNLTAHTSERCPECGRDLAQKRAVVFGERKRVPAWLALGGLLLLAAPPLGYTSWKEGRRVNWFNYMPDKWLIGYLSSSKPGEMTRAWRALEQRRKNGTLGDAVLDDWIAFCLWLQTRKPHHPFLNGLDLLHELFRNGQLDEGQRATFLKNGFLIRKVMIRPRVAAGQPCLIGWVIDRRMPHRMFCDWRVILERDGANPEQIDGHSRSSGGMSDDLTVHAPVMGLSLGAHVLTLTFEINLSTGPHGSDVIVHHETRRFDLRTAVLPELPAGEIRAVHSTALDNSVLACIGQVAVFTQPDPRGGLSLCVQVNSTEFERPVGLAFDVHAEFDGKRMDLGALCFSPGAERFGRQAGRLLPEPPPETVDVVLRASEEAALMSPDIAEIWDGELRFEDVPVGSGMILDWREVAQITPTIRRR